MWPWGDETYGVVAMVALTFQIKCGLANSIDGFLECD